jgi:hypothetical protein
MQLGRQAGSASKQASKKARHERGQGLWPTCEKMDAAMMAPSLPAAAEMPWKKARTSVGYTSPATRKEVQLGPNWLKKELRK